MHAGGVPTNFGIRASVGGFAHPCAQPRFGWEALEPSWEGAGAWNGDGEVAKHSVSHMVVGQTKAEELDENGRGTSFDFSGGTKGRK